MRKTERFVVLEGARLRGGRISWEYAYMATGRREAKAALKEDMVRVFEVSDKGDLRLLKP